MLNNGDGATQSLFESLYVELIREGGFRPKVLGVAGMARITVYLDHATFYNTGQRMSDAINVCMRVLQSNWSLLLNAISTKRNASTQ